MMSTTNSGILLIDKPAGVTSRYVGNFISKKLGIKKVGHLGTLDPFATGLLVIALGEGTKVLPYLEDDTKTYVSTIKFGFLTTTLDPEGDVFINEEIAPFAEGKIKEIMDGFVGEITQIPPLTSAIKINGKRAYQYAHAGEEVEVPPRRVTVSRLRIIEYFHPFLTFEATVSKGTYIRTLGADIANALDSVATTVKLRRTKQGSLDVSSAITIDEVDHSHIISVSHALNMYPVVTGDARTIYNIQNGQMVHLQSTKEIIQLHNESGILIALCRRIDDKYRVLRGFNLWKSPI